MSAEKTFGQGAPLVEEVVAARLPDTVPATLAKAADALGRRTVWHVNTTALGGGVAELLRTTVPQHRGCGVRARWIVALGTADFFGLTKQLHHLLHGMPGNGQALTPEHAECYAAVTMAQAEAMLARVDPTDIVVLHDPQPLGLAPVLHRLGAHVIWRCHIGTRDASRLTAAAWAFLAPYLAAVDQFVFSAAAYVPPILDGRPVTVLPPAIDPSGPKCRPMGPDETDSILRAVGLHAGASHSDRPNLAGAARVIQDEPLPADAQAVVQISRWDPLKDMRGVLAAFADHIAPSTAAHLVLAGPDPDEVSDDTENAAVLADVVGAWAALPGALRRRVHLAILRLSDRQANPLIVNALQRRATVVAQKSLEEGFGLAVTEAMYKRKPVVASGVGGILEQVTHRTHGLLVQPQDGAAFGAAVRELLADPGLAARLGAAAGARCDRVYLVDQEHEGYARLFLSALGYG
jgi:trehalose synthase